MLILRSYQPRSKESTLTKKMLAGGRHFFPHQRLQVTAAIQYMTKVKESGQRAIGGGHSCTLGERPDRAGVEAVYIFHYTGAVRDK